MKIMENMSVDNAGVFQEVIKLEYLHCSLVQDLFINIFRDGSWHFGGCWDLCLRRRQRIDGCLRLYRWRSEVWFTEVGSSHDELWSSDRKPVRRLLKNLRDGTEERNAKRWVTSDLITLSLEIFDVASNRDSPRWCKNRQRLIKETTRWCLPTIRWPSTNQK